MKNLKTSIQIAKSLLKRPFLISGSVFLMIAWFWEKYAVTDYQESVQTLQRLHNEFQTAVLQEKISQFSSEVGESLYKLDSSTYSLYNLCNSYANEITNLRNLDFGSKMLTNDLRATGYDISNELKNTIEETNGLRDRRKIDSLAELTAEYRKNVSKEHVEAQVKYSQLIDNEKEKLSWQQMFQDVLYVLGVLLLAVDRGIVGFRKDELDTSMKESFNKLIHKTNELSKKQKP